MAEIAARYRHRPAGFGALGRAWSPRLPRAGTYDADWLAHRHPGLPEDFDFRYWNGAPDDQQTDYLPPGGRVELWHLADPRLSRSGYCRVDLPAHRPFVLARLDSGVMLPLPMLTDTAVIDTDAGLVTLTHRTWIASGTPVRVAEARFETDPAAPLVRLARGPLRPTEMERRDG